MRNALPFSGLAAPLAPTDIADAARMLNASPAHVHAVKKVETGPAGAFLSDGSGRPVILFEAHLFSRETLGRYDKIQPSISSPSWNRALYAGGAAEYPRLERAVAIDSTAALRSASWGGFQILGQNHAAAGYATVQGYVDAMAAGERQQLMAFVSFIRANPKLLAALQAGDWATFARIYNGPAYRENRYDTKLLAAFIAAGGDAGGRTMDPMLARASTLQMGSRGSQVQLLQQALRRAGETLQADGIFGRATELAVQRFQAARGLVTDGVVGPATASRLGLT